MALKKEISVLGPRSARYNLSGERALDMVSVFLAPRTDL